MMKASGLKVKIKRGTLAGKIMNVSQYANDWVTVYFDNGIKVLSLNNVEFIGKGNAIKRA